jgi:hypothetical protein
MVPIVEKRIEEAAASGLLPSREEAVKVLRRSAARLCATSGYDEADPVVRPALFTAAYALYPSVGNRFWLTAGPATSAPMTRFLMKVSDMPRSTARHIYQALKGSPAKA